MHPIIASRKFIVYKTYAHPRKRTGQTKSCQCGFCKEKFYTDNIDQDASIVTCAKCSMGLADGIVFEKQNSNRKIRIKPLTKEELS